MKMGTVLRDSLVLSSQLGSEGFTLSGSFWAMADFKITQLDHS